MSRPPIVDDRLGFEGLSRGAIRNWRLLVLGFVGLVFVAGLAWRKIPRLEDPAVEPPIAVVTIPYPGASAADVDALVVRPVEEELFGMDGIDFVESRSFPNYAQIVMRFEVGTPMDSVTETLRGKVAGKRKQLPREVGDPVVTRVKTSTFTANMVVTLVGNRADGVLGSSANQLKEALMTVPGVASVTLRGARRPAVRIRIDPVRLAEHHLHVRDVVERLKLANVRIPGGEVPVGSLVTLLSVNHELAGSAGVAKVPIAASTDPTGATHTVTLGDIADIRDGFRTTTERMLEDGIPAVGLEIRFRPGESSVEVGRRVVARLDTQRASLPEGVAITITHDQPEWVRRSLSSFVDSLIEGVALVLLVITIGMGWRSALVVAAVLPLAIAGAVFGLYAAGMALEQVSIAGLIVALGLLVDDAVVVAESIQLMRDRGLSAVRAAVLGTARVFWANNGTTAVAIASFLPLFFLGGDIGVFIRGLPMAVVLSLVTSLLVAQLLTPWIATFLSKAPRGVAPISDASPFDRQQDSAGAPHDERNAMLRATKHAYAWIIPKIVEHPVKVVGLATVFLVLSCALLPKVGIQFFPKADKPVLFVSVELPPGTDDSVTAQRVAQVVSAVRKDPAVRSTSAIIGSAYPNIFAGRAMHRTSKDFGDVLVQLSSASTEAIAERLRARASSIPGARITVEELYTGPPVSHPILVRVQGEDHAALRRHAEEVKARLRAIPGAVNVSDSMSDSIPVMTVEVDADRALRVGVTPAHVGGALRAAYGEDEITTFRHDRDTIEVVVESSQAGLSPLESVAHTPIPSVSGRAVPVLAVADVRITQSAAELRRRNTQPVVEISADVAGGRLASDVLARVEPSLASMRWEKGTTYAFGGEQAETEKSFRNLGIAAAITLVIIFVLLVLMFRSLTRAVIVLAAVPYVLIGAVPGLYLTHNPFGFMAFLGLVALVGVYVNHKIYFVDRMFELVRRGAPWRDAIHQAGIDRLRPVVLTALTAILGLLPMTLGGAAYWSAFGWVTVFGLAVSVPLSLVLLPALLAISYRFRTPEIAHQDVERTLVMVHPLPFASRRSDASSARRPSARGGDRQARFDERAS